MFGSSNTGSSGGGLFGSSSSSTTGSSAFGANTSGGGLFGSSNSNQSSNSGGLFGSSATSTNNTTSSGGLFGSSSTPGASNTNSAGGGLFGSATSGTNNTASSGGLFGSKSNTGSTGSSLFGSGNPSTGTFGSNRNSGGGLFGNGTNTGSSMFGNSTQQSSSLFGNSTSNGGSLFGGSNSTGNVNPQQQQQMIASQQQTGPWWLRELQSIEAAYQPGPGSKFQTMLYEVVGVAPDLLCVSGAMAPAHLDLVKSQRKKEILSQIPWVSQRDWIRAEEQNPDPTNWMPSALDGVKALHERVKAQACNVQEQLALLHYDGTKDTTQSGAEESKGAALGDNVKKVWLENVDTGDNFDSMIDQCKHEHTRLILRLIKVMGRLERLQSIRSRGGRMRTEIDFGTRIKELQKVLSDPRGCKAQLAQLAAQVRVSDSESVPRASQDSRLFQGENNEQSIFNFLEMQREGLEHLMNVVKKDNRDMQIMKRRIQPHLN